jgi:hypothetical protein
LNHEPKLAIQRGNGYSTSKRRNDANQCERQGTPGGA